MPLLVVNCWPVVEGKGSKGSKGARGAAPRGMPGAVLVLCAQRLAAAVLGRAELMHLDAAARAVGGHPLEGRGLTSQRKTQSAKT